MRFPPMPALTTAKRGPYAACSRRASTSGQRSSPFRVEPVPSVIESPRQTIAEVPAGDWASTASRKYHDVVVKGNAPSPSSAPWLPLPGPLTYDVCSALACHVIGPVDPAAWKLTASLRPSRLPGAARATNGSATGSLTIDCPAGRVTVP